MTKIRDMAIATWSKKYPGSPANPDYVMGFEDCWAMTKPEVKTISITVKPGENDEYIITGRSISELLEYCMPLIASKKREHYKKELFNSLTQHKVGVIDRMAGNQVLYTVIYAP